MPLPWDASSAEEEEELRLLADDTTSESYASMAGLDAYSDSDKDSVCPGDFHRDAIQRVQGQVLYEEETCFVFARHDRESGEKGEEKDVEGVQGIEAVHQE